MDGGTHISSYVPHGSPMAVHRVSKGEIRGGGYRGERRGHRKRGCRWRGRMKEKDGGKESWGGEVFVKVPYIGSVAHVTTPAVSTPRVPVEKIIWKSIFRACYYLTNCITIVSSHTIVYILTYSPPVNRFHRSQNVRIREATSKKKESRINHL